MAIAAEKKMHFSELDGIRGLLCLMVLFYHWGLNTLLERLSSGYLGGGRWELAVDFFFSLSGFVLCHSTSRKTSITIREFLVKRCVRLLPVSIVCLLIALLAKPSFLERPVETAANLLLIQVFLGYPSFNGASWSACLELWVPGLFIYLSRFRYGSTAWMKLVLAGFLCLQAMVLCGLIFSSRYEEPLARSFFGLLGGFALYLLCARTEFRFRSGRFSNLLAYTLISGIVSVMCLAGKFGALVCLFPFLTVCTIVVCLTSRTVLSGRIFQYFGKRSYSIYMVHMPLILLIMSLPGSAALQGNVLLKAGAIAVTIVIADLIHRFIELPAMKLCRAPASRKIEGTGLAG